MSAPEADGPKRIMLIDDDGVCLAMLSAGMRRRGYTVCAYSDPREALQRLALDLPSAVITDMRMPHMSGLDIVAEVKARLGDHAPPVIVVSATDEEAMLEEAFRLGANDYLLKPVSDAELGVKLERALKPSKSRMAQGQLGQIPEQIGPWTLLDCIGRGGTAAVFTARREGQTVLRALKVVWPHLVSNTETLLRFRREIDTLCGLEHPRLVRFLESGRHEACFYYIMDYLPGGTLRGRIRDHGPLSPDEALRVVEQIAEPLGYLHDLGLVHRDVKPGNIYYDAKGDVVLGDFGLTKRIPDHGITLSREFIGTPLYLAPEVFRSPEFDQSVDFYALGVSAFEMVLGQAPITEPDSVTLIAKLMDKGLPRPLDLVPTLPPAVSRLLDRLLHRDPKARYRTAPEVLDDGRRARAELAGA